MTVAIVSMPPAACGSGADRERQFGRRYLHAAGIRLSIVDAVADRLHILAIMECDPGSSGIDFGQLPIGDDLKFHNGLMRRAVQFRCLEQAYIVGTALMLHEIIDVPRRWQRCPHARYWGGTMT